MAFSFEDFLSGAGMGASAGSAAGLPGLLIGGLGGGLLSGFAGGNEKPKTPEYVNPYESQINYNIDRQMNSTLGRQAAGINAGILRNQANDAFEQFSANPAFSDNPAEAAEAYNKVQREAGRGIQSAYIEGARQDESTRNMGLQNAADQARLKQQDFQFRTQLDAQQANQTTPLQQLLLTAGSYGLGTLIGNASQPATVEPQVETPLMKAQAESGIKLGDKPVAPNRSPFRGALSPQTLSSTIAPPQLQMGGTGLKVPQASGPTSDAFDFYNTGGLFSRGRTLSDILMSR